jgi:adenosylmethionine-8-amino-7-oxononanoate aminotransferase
MGLIEGLIGQGLGVAIKAASNTVPESLLKALDNENLEEAVDDIAATIHAMDDKSTVEKRVELAKQLQNIVNEHDLDDVAANALEGVLHKVLGLHIDL